MHIDIMLNKLTNAVEKYYQRMMINFYSLKFIPPKSTVHHSIWHENFIAHLASLIQPKLYVEVGLDKGQTFNKVLPYARKLIGIDINKKCAKYIKESHKVTFYCINSAGFAKLARKNKLEINMLFIDADHWANQVLKDFNNLFPFVSDNGLIFLHDSFPKAKENARKGEAGTVYRAIEKLAKNSKTYEMVTMPIPPGLTICRKRKSQVAWETRKS